MLYFLREVFLINAFKTLKAYSCFLRICYEKKLLDRLFCRMDQASETELHASKPRPLLNLKQDIFDGVNKSLSYDGRIFFFNSGGEAEGKHSLRIWKDNP